MIPAVSAARLVTVLLSQLCVIPAVSALLLVTVLFSQLTLSVLFQL